VILHLSLAALFIEENVFHFAQNISERGHLIRFRNHAISAAFNSPLDIGMKLRIRPDKDFEPGEVRPAPDPLQDLKAVQFGHADIEQNQIGQRMGLPVGIRALSGEIGHGFLTVADYLEFYFLGRKLLGSKFQKTNIIRIIFSN